MLLLLLLRPCPYEHCCPQVNVRMFIEYCCTGRTALKQARAVRWLVAVVRVDNEALERVTLSR